MTRGSRLLFNAHPLVIDPELAALIGLNESIILQQIHYWTEMNRKSGRNFKEGFHWTFNSVASWQEQFPFWSADTIKRTLVNLRKKDILVVGNFNKLRIDRTLWYRIDYGALDSLKIVSGNGQCKMPPPLGQNAPMGEFTGLEGGFDPDAPIDWPDIDGYRMEYMMHKNGRKRSKGTGAKEIKGY